MSSINPHESFRRSITSIHLGSSRSSFKRISRSSSLPSAAIAASAFAASTATAIVFPTTPPSTARRNSATRKVAPAPEGPAPNNKFQRSHSQNAIVPYQDDLQHGDHHPLNSMISRLDSQSKTLCTEERGVHRELSSATLTTQPDAFDFEFRPQPKDSENEKERYSLGESVRCPSHMIIEADDVAAHNAALSLKSYEFAFVKRSDGQWTYAILAYRSFENVHRGKPHRPKDMQDCMTFVVNSQGALKTIEEKRWGQYIRLVSDGVQGAKRNLIDDVLAVDDDSIASDLFE